MWSKQNNKQIVLMMVLLIMIVFLSATATAVSWHFSFKNLITGFTVGDSALMDCTELEGECNTECTPIYVSCLKDCSEKKDELNSCVSICDSTSVVCENACKPTYDECLKPKVDATGKEIPLTSEQKQLCKKQAGQCLRPCYEQKQLCSKSCEQTHNTNLCNDNCNKQIGECDKTYKECISKVDECKEKNKENETPPKESDVVKTCEFSGKTIENGKSICSGENVLSCTEGKLGKLSCPNGCNAETNTCFSKKPEPETEDAKLNQDLDDLFKSKEQGITEEVFKKKLKEILSNLSNEYIDEITKQMYEGKITEVVSFLENVKQKVQEEKNKKIKSVSCKSDEECEDGFTCVETLCTVIVKSPNCQITPPAGIDSNCYKKIIEQDEFCCNPEEGSDPLWDDVWCQIPYQICKDKTKLTCILPSEFNKNDPCYIETITIDPLCCNEWDDYCTGEYDDVKAEGKLICSSNNNNNNNNNNGNLNNYNNDYDDADYLNGDYPDDSGNNYEENYNDPNLNTGDFDPGNAFDSGTGDFDSGNTNGNAIDETYLDNSDNLEDNSDNLDPTFTVQSEYEDNLETKRTRTNLNTGELGLDLSTETQKQAVKTLPKDELLIISTNGRVEEDNKINLETGSLIRKGSRITTGITSDSNAVFGIEDAKFRAESKTELTIKKFRTTGEEKELKLGLNWGTIIAKKEKESNTRAIIDVPNGVIEVIEGSVMVSYDQERKTTKVVVDGKAVIRSLVETKVKKLENEETVIEGKPSIIMKLVYFLQG